MNRYYIFSFISLLLGLNVYGQSQYPNHEAIADSFFSHFQYTKASVKYSLAAYDFEQRLDWENCTRNYRKAGQALLKAAKPDSASYFIQKALNIIDSHFAESRRRTVEKIYILLAKVVASHKKCDYPGEMKACQSALKEALTIDSALLLARVWNELGKAYLDQSRFDSAIYFCQKSFDARVKALQRKHEDIAESNYSVGLIFEAEGDWDKAMKYYKEAIQIQESLWGEQHPDIANTYNSVAIIYYAKGNIDTAFEYAQKATQIRISLLGEFHPDVATSYNNCALLYQLKSEFDKALNCYNMALAILKENYGETYPVIADIYEGVGVMYGNIGDYNKALEYHEKSLKTRLAVWGETNKDVALNYNNIGIIYYYKGDIDKALLFYYKSLQTRLAISGEKSPELAICYNNIGVIYSKKYDIDKALEYYQKALSIQVAIHGEQHPDVVYSYNNIGLIFHKKKNFDKALEYLNMALRSQIAIGGEQTPSVATMYFNMGEVYTQKKDYTKAWDFYNRALKIDHNIYGQKHPDIADVYNHLGDLSDKAGNYAEALNYVQRAIISNSYTFHDSSIYHNPPLVNILSKPSLKISLIKKAGIFYKQSQKNNSRADFEASLSAYEHAFQLIYRMRNGYNETDTKLMLSQHTKADVMNAVHSAVLFHKDFPSAAAHARAWEFIEKGKSATLAYELKQLKEIHFAGIPDSLIEIEKRYKQKILELATAIDKEKHRKEGYDTIKMNMQESDYFAYSQKLDSLILYFEKEYPSYYTLKYSDELPSIDEMKKSMDKQTVLLNYLVGDSSLFISTITDTLFHVQEIKIDSTLKKTALAYYKNIKKANTESFVANSTYLFNMLMKPVMPFLKDKQRLMIIPDEYLYYLPFETLISKGDPGNPDFTKLDYLLKTYSIAYHYSATLWFNSMKKNAAQSTKLKHNFVGFAPVFSPKENNGAILSNYLSVLDTTEDTKAYRKISADLKSFSPLPYSKEEVSSIFRLFEKKKKEAKAYLYSDASESNFKSNTSNYTYVHISSHGFSNDKIPNLSGIVFSQPLDTSAINMKQQEDGILYAGEAYNLTLNADLVVLSSCEGGLGKLIKGEGMQALSRGFIYAGTPNIIFSLWKALDKPTKDLMVNFYANVLDGKPYADALRVSKLALIKDPKTAFPHFWGSFILVGR